MQHSDEILSLYLSAPRSSFVRGVLLGLKAPLIGWTHLKKTPRLWRYVWGPALLNTLFTLALLVLAYYWGSHVQESLLAGLSDAWWKTLLEYFLYALLFLGLLLLVPAGLFLFSSLFCGTFYGLLAERVEQEIGTGGLALRPLSVWKEVQGTFRTLAEIVVWNVGVLALSFLPFVGPVIGGLLGWYGTCFLLGLEYLEYPLSLRGLTRKQRKQIARHHRPETMGLGTAAIVFSFLPIVGSVLLTTQVVGSVFLSRSLLNRATALKVSR